MTITLLQCDCRAWFLASRVTTSVRLSTKVVPRGLPIGLPRVWRLRPDVEQYARVYERIQ